MVVKKSKKGRFPGITDLHIHQHSNGLTLTATYKGYKEHLDLDLRQTVEDFGETLDSKVLKLDIKLYISRYKSHTSVSGSRS